MPKQEEITTILIAGLKKQTAYEEHKIFMKAYIEYLYSRYKTMEGVRKHIGISRTSIYRLFKNMGIK